MAQPNDLSSIAVVMPAHNAEDTVGACLDALISAGFEPAQITVVDDGSTDRTGEIVSGYGVTMLSNETAARPAEARNKGAAAAGGDVILFVDADVRVAPDVRQLFDRHFADATCTGVFGSYDNSPQSKSLVGRYRNLLHAHTHQISGGEVPTFWTGLGAIRRDAFETAGGFLRDWENIEDVELGLKVTANGGRIRLDPKIRGKHLKDWSVGSMFKTDMLGRAVPWTRLLKSGRMPVGVLSTSLGKRISAAAVACMGLSFVLGFFWSPAWLATLAALGAFIVANAGFVRFLAQSNGVMFAVAALPFHVMHHVAAILGFAKVTLLERSVTPKI